jgi:ABC-type dipeptide/oligopeptide/nickel transport system ATPase subunit
MEKLAAQDQTITQTVNQVQGIRMNGAIEDATQTVNQTLNRIATNTEEMNVYAEIATEHVEHMRQDLSQSVNIQRNINDSLTQSVDIQKDIRTNTEETAVWTELTAETNERTANTLSNLDNGSGISRRSDREIPRNPNSPDD